MKTLLTTALMLAALSIAGLSQGLSNDELKAKAKSLKANKEIIVSYDKFRDSSVISSKQRNLASDAEGIASIMSSGTSTSSGVPKLLMLSLVSTYDGQTLKKSPSEFVMRFETLGPGWEFINEVRTLYLLIDGQRLEVEPLDYKTEVGRYGLSGTTSTKELLLYRFSREQVQSMVDAKTFEIRIGGPQQRARKIKPEIQKSWRLLMQITSIE